MSPSKKKKKSNISFHGQRYGDRHPRGSHVPALSPLQPGRYIIDTQVRRDWSGSGHQRPVGRADGRSNLGREQNRCRIPISFHHSGKTANDANLPEKSTAGIAINRDAEAYSTLRGKKALIAVGKEAEQRDACQSSSLFCHDSAKAGSGLEAIRLLDRDKYDVIIADADIPEWPILAERLSRPDLQSLPVIEVGFLGEKARTMQAKIKAFLTKPVREAQLGSALLRIFGDKEKTVRTRKRNCFAPHRIPKLSHSSGRGQSSQPKSGISHAQASGV